MAALNPTIRAVRAPNTRREKMSRPIWSVPSRWIQLGACIMALKSFSSGSKGAIQSANRPAANMTSTITKPNVPSGWRRQNFSATLKSDGRRSALSSASSGTAVRLGSVTVMGGRPSREADARIEPGVEHVDHEVGDDEDGDHQHDQCLSQHVVLVLHCLHEQLANAGQVEDLLRDNQAADQEGEFDADQGHHGQQRVLQRMS